LGLDGKEAEIQILFAKKVSKASIAKILNYISLVHVPYADSHHLWRLLSDKIPWNFGVVC